MITEFMNYISSVKGYSDNTVVAYGKDLRDFVQYVKDIDPKESWSTITQGMIQSYVVSLHERDLENTTIKRRVGRACVPARLVRPVCVPGVWTAVAKRRFHQTETTFSISFILFSEEESSMNL